MFPWAPYALTPAWTPGISGSCEGVREIGDGVFNDFIVYFPSRFRIAFDDFHLIFITILHTFGESWQNIVPIRRVMSNIYQPIMVGYMIR